MNTDHFANRTHRAYALGYYYGRVNGVDGVPDLSRTVDLLEDFYRLGYAQGLKDQWAEQGEQGLTIKL